MIERPHKVDPWMQEHLVCPRDFQRFTFERHRLICLQSHVFPCVDGIPIILLEECEPTESEFRKTLEVSNSGQVPIKLAKTEELIGTCPELELTVDPFVQEVIAATGGNIYKGLAGRLARYPIPELRLPPARAGETFLDLGCNWGRWCISAARKGYASIGIDHNLEAIATARRIARQLGLSMNYLVADARHLPFAGNSMDVVFSYSVLQHFTKVDVRQTLSEVSRVLNPSGMSFIQMANLFGPRNLHQQWKLRNQPFRPFDVHYWSPFELMKTFNQYVGHSSLQADGYFTLNAQLADLDLMNFKLRSVLRVSDLLRGLSEFIPGMKYLADSIYVKSRKESGEDE